MRVGESLRRREREGREGERGRERGGGGEREWGGWVMERERGEGGWLRERSGRFCLCSVLAGEACRHGVE